VVPGDAVYLAAGVPHGFLNQGGGDTEIVQFFAPAGPEERYKGANGAGPSAADSIVSAPKGPQPLVRSAANAQAFAIAAGRAEIRIILDEAISGDASAYVGALTAQVGAVIPPHRHANSSEYLLVLEGVADMHIAGRRMRIQPGDAVQIPASVEHSGTIVGNDAFKAIQFYAPAGPEQRFKSVGSALPANRGTH